ncbi:hypothetical protein HDV04_005678 [Boothiomyces sp. JEL0838]|nr:hypothetical protein HDV04_005678 [Boothiomyces sp. JEL0838]
MRLIPVLTDAALISTALAGIRRAGSFEYPTNQIQNATLRWISNKFLQLGEFLIDVSVDIAKNNPKVFKPIENIDNVSSEKVIKSLIGMLAKENVCLAVKGEDKLIKNVK